VYREYEGGDDTPSLERSTLHVTDYERRVALIEARGDKQDHPLPVRRII
jgi:hypothetical protein